MKRKSAALHPLFPDLATYLRDTGDTQARVAFTCGTTGATISRIASGRIMPRAELALRISTYARIPLDSFTRAYLARRMQRVA